VSSDQWPAGTVKALHWPQMAREVRKGRKGRKGRMGRIKRRLPRRVHARFIGLSRNILALNAICMFFYFHNENLTISAQNRKTYGRLLGMIFSEALGSLVIIDLQWLATQKIFKKRKNTYAKCHFLLRGRPFFCQNAPKNARFLCQY
jgi:hypothetical protein